MEFGIRFKSMGFRQICTKFLMDFLENSMELTLKPWNSMRFIEFFANRGFLVEYKVYE